MLKIVVGGQINKKEIFDYIQNYYGTENVKLEIKNDLDAVMAMQSGQFDYYIGACNTGGGGALAMAITLLGVTKCKTISMPGKILPDEEIKKAVDDGIVAFGFTASHVEQVLPVLLDAIDHKNEY